MKESQATKKEKEKGFFWVLVDLFRSLKLTISLLILLAILSIIGTLITQNASRGDYIQRYGVGLYEVLNFFNLFDMYHSWWFIAILLLLVINLLACTLQRVSGIWRQVFSPLSGELEASTLKALPFVEKMKIVNLPGSRMMEEMGSCLKRLIGYPKRVETETSVTFCSEKGRFSRLGVPITHLSILIILIGGLLGSFYGFKGFVSIPEGETVDQIYLRSKDEEIPKPLGFSVRCDDFNVSYYNLSGREKHVKEYVSKLTILENGKEVLTKTVEVNHPLHYRGLAFYQSSYGTLHDVLVGVQWKNRSEKELLRVIEGGTAPIPNSAALIRVLQYSPQVHNFGQGAQVALLQPNQEPRAFWLLKGVPNFDQQGGGDFILTFEGVTSREYTGLQVARDPGVWVVWIGSGLMILGLIVSFFFSHQRAWIKIPKTPGGEAVVAGSTSKNRIGFEKSFGQLVDGVRDIMKSDSQMPRSK